MRKLRDNRERSDPRLDRIPLFDERSRAFPIRAVIDEDVRAARQFRSYTWRIPVVLDQGREGACVGFGVAAELAARPSMVEGITDETARQLYYEAQRLDPWPGGEYPGASPRYAGTSVLSGMKVAHKAGYFDSYRWGFGINDLLLGVGYHGPAVIGINWREGMYDAPDGRVRVEGPIVGGHCLVVHAVNVPDRTVRWHNSWGPEYGIEGEAEVSWSDMESLLLDDGEACWAVGRRKNPKPRPI